VRHPFADWCAESLAEASVVLRGMIIGTSFTLFVVPSIYMLTARAG
jgi:multidrug efflux pump subunit AcrB